MRSAMISAVCATALFAAAPWADAAVLVHYGFGSPGQETTAETGPAYAPTFKEPGLTATAVSEPMGTIGIEISSAPTTPASAPYLRVDPQGNSASAAAAVTANKYFQFTLTADAGNLLTITSLDFNVARGGGSTPRGYVVRSSADNYANNLATADVLTARPIFTAVSIPLAGTGFTDLNASNPLTFRIYSYSPGAGSSVDYDDIRVHGVIPEPTSLALLALSGSALLFRRRRA